MPGVAAVRRAPRGTVCAQGCAQPSRRDAISGVSREGPSAQPPRLAPPQDPRRHPAPVESSSERQPGEVSVRIVARRWAIAFGEPVWRAKRLYTEGTMKSVKRVARLTPEKITTPSAWRLADPGPCARINGTDPITAE